MARANLQLDLPPTFSDEFVATWDIVDADLEIVARGTFFDRHADALDLPAGKFWARVQFPNGQTESRAFVLADANATAQVKFEFRTPSKHEWLGWTTLSEAPALTARRGDGSALQDVWTRAWMFVDGHWEPSEEANDALLMQDDDVYQLELAPTSPYLRALQIGGDAIASRCVVLPAQGVTRVLITASGDAAGSGDAIEIAVSLRNSMADHLARFLTVASPSGRDGIDNDLRRSSTELLYGKRQDPLGAAVGGYFLLADRSNGLPLDWLKNLMTMAPWMADGAILFAHATAMSRRRDGVDEAIDALVQASRRGYPVIRRGIGVFLDVCRMIGSSDQPLPPEIDRQATLYARVRAAETRQSVFTTFYGAQPDEPDVQREHRSAEAAAAAPPQPAAPVPPPVVPPMRIDLGTTDFDAAPRDAPPFAIPSPSVPQAPSTAPGTPTSTYGSRGMRTLSTRSTGRTR